MTVATLTKPAFDKYRASSSLRSIHPDVERFTGDTDQMSPEDGLADWSDGSVSSGSGKGASPAVDPQSADIRLWVVTESNVLHAPEQCAFGGARDAGRVKHSNLTGGGAAYAGGELVFVDEQTIILNGASGRYRVDSAEEMTTLCSAFRQSGYNVWSMGYSSDTNQPYRFGEKDPEWVSV